MDVKDLMIGDIVFYLDNEKLIEVKVLNIDGISKVIRVQNSDGHHFNVMAESLFPSPLNAVSLRSNGFKDDASKGCLVFQEAVPQASEDGKEINIELTPITDNKHNEWEIKGFGQFHAYVRYFYQLQHCMKFIGFKKEFNLE